ncbi:siderophore-interacting protein [Streptomyces griseus]|uniref:Siderophore-interacting protein n=1 Tax=Streptomyces sp. CMC78 TaxID=3231512 RepID=A0AB33KJ67_9ACTN|nr:siderophore-interacting protein [Streptomyces fimicarius]WTC87452.1 siderophore-interacting protein [Streptomyces griseus]WTD69925.1 siderophore-interacting protein [Streptomyces griseus]
MSQAMPVSYVRVTGVERITPRTARVGFTGEALPRLLEDRPDQQMKLCLPREGRSVREGLLPERDADDPYGMRWYEAFLAIPEADRPWMRGFTVRSYDRERNVMAVDFVLHGADGPASRWGAAARPGDVLGMVGPSSLYARPLPAARRMLLAGDESALPAIATVLEALPAGTGAVVYAEVADAAEERGLPSAGGGAEVRWVHRDRGGALVDAVRDSGADLDGVDAAWVAGEASAVRALRRHLVEDRRLPKAAVEFSGYWRRALTQDDAPTEEDLAWAAERAADTS